MVIAIDIIKFIILILITFFMCQIISNKKKRISYIGTILICFSTAIIEYINMGLIEALIFGEAFIIGFHNLLNKVKFKYLWSILMIFSIIGFGLLSNLVFQISIGITILTISLYIFLKYHKEKTKEIEAKEYLKKVSSEENLEDYEIEAKKYKRLWIITIIGIVLAIIICVVFYKYEKFNLLENKNGSSYIMNYTYSVMLPFDKEIKFENSKCLATMISIFPIGLMISVYYIFRYENKHTEFLMPSILVSIIELIILISNKISWFIPNYILALGFALLQIYMIIYIFANIEEKLFSLKKASYISILGIIFILLVPFPNKIFSINSRIIPYCIFIVESIILLNYTDKRFCRLGSWLFTVICLFEFIGYIFTK